MNLGWIDEEIQKVNVAQDLHCLCEIGIEHITRRCAGLSGVNVVQICGPMTTGGILKPDGTADFDANMRRFKRAVELVYARSESDGFVLFNQIPLQPGIIRVLDYFNQPEYPLSVLDDIYVPIFQRKLVTKVYMLPGWDRSIGSRIEFEAATQNGISVEEIPLDWVMRQEP